MIYLSIGLQYFLHRSFTMTEQTLDERKELHKSRLKDNRIQYILDIMRKNGITTKDLVDFEDQTNMDKLNKLRSVHSRILKSVEGLRKAREVRKEQLKSGKQAKGEDVRPVKVRGKDSDNEE